jgi:two-component system sensor histidine kinase DegS
MTDAGSTGQETAVDAFQTSVKEELEKVRGEIDEIGLLVDQSQGEVDKITERNALVTAKIHQLHTNFDTVPREDIRSAYEEAQDTQQRLFTMRGQVEKLNGGLTILERFEGFLARTLSLLEQTQGLKRSASAPMTDSVIQKVITAQEEERRKISRQMHDGPAQGLANFILQAEIAMRLFEVDQDKAREELVKLQQTAGSTFDQLRDFIFDLRPMMLDDLGLIPTVRRYLNAFKEKTGVDVNLVVTGTERRLEDHHEVLVFRAFQELLGMLRDQSQATKVKIAVDVRDDQVRTSIEDNGRGFASEGSEDTPGSGQVRGLEELRERIAQVGGTLEVQSTPGEGSRVVFTIPTGG